MITIIKTKLLKGKVNSREGNSPFNWPVLQAGRHEVLVEVDLLPVLEGDRGFGKREDGVVRVTACQPQEVRRGVAHVMPWGREDQRNRRGSRRYVAVGI